MSSDSPYRWRVVHFTVNCSVSNTGKIIKGILYISKTSAQTEFRETLVIKATIFTKVEPIEIVGLSLEFIGFILKDMKILGIKS